MVTMRKSLNGARPIKSPDLIRSMITMIDTKSARKQDYTPVIQQYLEQKEKVDQAILLFRLGDFYEAFFEDGVTIARELEITLTARNDKGHPEGKVPMAGIPVKAAENYISRLLSAGCKVAICEQVGDKNQKGPIDRQLVRILTPGNIIESEYLTSPDNVYLAAIFPGKKQQWGLAYGDVSTGELSVCELAEGDLLVELDKLNPGELIIPASWNRDNQTGLNICQRIVPAGLDQNHYHLTERNAELCFNESFAVEHFGRPALKGFGCEGYTLALKALGALFEYLDYTCADSLQAFNSLKVISRHEYLQLDAYALRNLEIFETSRDQESRGSLFWLIRGFLSTKMGYRQMKQWLTVSFD